jgi:kynurenine formamidase
MSRVLVLLLFSTAGFLAAYDEKPKKGFEDYQLVDLSHAYNAETLYWPTSPSAFDHEELSFGQTDGGYFYSAYTLATPEHGGTHLDAPIHFGADKQTVDQIPLESLFLKAFVIDVREKADADPDYRLTLDDVQEFEATFGQIEKGSAVLLMTGWSANWPDALSYLGDDTPNDASNLHFPSFGEEAVKFLVEERDVKMIGIDTASIDYGASTDFMIHRVVAEHNIPGLENLTGLDQLPPFGALIIALPMKIEGGSGAPARVVGLIPSNPE